MSNIEFEKQGSKYSAHGRALNVLEPWYRPGVYDDFHHLLSARWIPERKTKSRRAISNETGAKCSPPTTYLLHSNGAGISELLIKCPITGGNGTSYSA